MKDTTNIENRIDGFVGQRMVYMPGVVKKALLKDPRVSDLYITHIGIFPKATGHLRKRPYGCSQYILIYCVEGAGWVEIEGRRRQIKANQIIVIPPKTPCNYGADKQHPWTNYWVHFSGENAGSYSPPTGKVLNIQPGDDARIDERLSLFEEMMHNAEDCFIQEKISYANVCLKLFLSSIRHLNVYRVAKKEKEDDLLEKMITFMKNNLHENMRVSKLAKICKCSESNIYKHFKNNLGTAPQDYFIHLKMERARRQLLQTNMKVKDIAKRLGYEDPYYFSRLFSKHVGLSPREYRREER